MSIPARVLYLEPVGEKGGAEVAVLDVATRLDRHRFEPLMASFRSGPLLDEAAAVGLRTFALPDHRTRQLHRGAAAVAALARVIRRERVEVVHANGGTTLVYASLAAVGTDARVVWHVHDPLSGRGLHERTFVAAHRRLRADHTIFANPSAAHSYRRTYPRLGPATTILPGIDLAQPGGDPERGRTLAGAPDGTPLVAMFARLQAFKGQLDLVEAAAMLAPRHPGIRFVLCGGSLFGREPGYAGRLRARIDSLGLRDQVIVTGYVADADRRDLLAAADIVAHPARYEPFGIAVLEAMAAAKPVVAASADGPSLTVVDGETGLLVPPGEPSALAAALDRLLLDGDGRRSMGAAGRRRAETFSIGAAVAATEQVYDEVLGRRDRQGVPA